MSRLRVVRMSFSTDFKSYLILSRFNSILSGGAKTRALFLLNGIAKIFKCYIDLIGMSLNSHQHLLIQLLQPPKLINKTKLIKKTLIKTKIYTHQELFKFISR